MIYATADMDPCIPINNLSTAHKHYKTHTHLCSTTKSTLETICNLSTAYDHQYLPPVQVQLQNTAAGLAQVSLPVSGIAAALYRQAEEGSMIPAEPLIILARTLQILFDPTATE